VTSFTPSDPAHGTNLIELALDMASRRSASADVVDFNGAKDHESEPVATRCASTRTNRACAIGGFPGFAAAFRLLKVPMFHSLQSLAVEIAVRDDWGAWNIARTMNFSLP
jgi:hypothetical protein